MRAWRWVRGTLATFLLGTSLTGCWDQHPVEFRAPVAGISVDPTREPDQYDFTFLFPNVTVTASSIATIPPSEQFYSISVQAPTLTKAIDSVQRRQSRALYLGQIRILCMSSRLPLKVWTSTLQQTADSGRFVMTFWVLTSPDARKALEITPPSEVVPDVALYRALNSRIQPVLWPGRGWRIWAEMATPGISPAVMEIHPTGQPTGQQVALHQLAVLSPHGILLWSTTETDGWAYAVGRVQRTTETVMVGNQPDSVGLIRGHAQTRVVQTPNGVTVQLHLRCSGVVVGGMMGQGDSIAMDRQVEKRTADLIQQKVVAAWHEAVVTHTDPMGFHRLGHWSDANIDDNVANWSGWTLETQVRFTLREEGVLR